MTVYRAAAMETIDRLLDLDLSVALDRIDGATVIKATIPATASRPARLPFVVVTDTHEGESLPAGDNLCAAVYAPLLGGGMEIVGYLYDGPHDLDGLADKVAAWIADPDAYRPF